jgi:hypothetical protein
MPVNEQYGYSTNPSTENILLINKILLEMNNKLTDGGIFCDLEKAFDCVNIIFYYLIWNCVVQ